MAMFAAGFIVAVIGGFLYRVYQVVEIINEEGF